MHSTATATANLSAALRAARSRRIITRLLSELGLAAAVLAALFCVLLLMGAQVLGIAAWLLLAVLGVAIVAWRMRGEWLSEYAVAQALDRHFALPDTLSTAWHFERSDALSANRLAHLQPMIDRQRHEAADALNTIQVADAFPFQFSRVHLAAMLLCALAIGLFAWRYMGSESLSFQEQLASMHIPFVDGGDEAPLMLADETYAPYKEIDEKSPLAEYQPEYEPSRERLDGTYNDMPPVSGISVNNDEGGQDGDSMNAESESASDMRSQMASDPRRQPGADSKEGGDQRGEKKAGDQKGNSLFDKFQQAVNNMMDKLSNKDNPQMEQRGDSQKSQQAKNQGDQQGDGSDDTSNREGNQRSENAQGNENAKEGMGGKNAKEVNQQTNAAATEQAADAPSSVGAEDGSKDLAAARQMEAMGKIAEILGQRADQVKGEVKVEVEAQKEQTLNTELKNIRATHSDTGGEMNRDEVPLRLQNYVKEYMKAARRAEAATDAPNAPARNR